MFLLEVKYAIYLQILLSLLEVPNIDFLITSFVFTLFTHANTFLNTATKQTMSPVLMALMN